MWLPYEGNTTHHKCKDVLVHIAGNVAASLSHFKFGSITVSIVFKFGTRITIPLEGVMCPNGIRISIGHPVFTSIALFTFTEGWTKVFPC